MFAIAGGILIAGAIIGAVVFGFAALGSDQGGCGCVLLIAAALAVAFFIL